MFRPPVTLYRILLSCGMGLLLLASGLQAQDTAQGSGVISYYDDTSTHLNAYHLYDCRDAACQRFYQLFIPTLFESTPFTEALIADAPPIPQQEQTYHIAEGAVRPDGHPITAYDVAFSLLFESHTVNGMRVDDEQRFTILYNDPPSCYTHSQINKGLSYAPIHDVQLVESVAEFQAGQEGVPLIADWQAHYWRAFFGLQYPIRQSPENHSQTAYTYVIDAGRQINYAQQGDQVIVPLHLNKAAMEYPTAVQSFLQGEANLLINPPPRFFADLRATPDIQTYEAPGNTVRVLAFNPAIFDPTLSSSYSDGRTRYSAFLEDPQVREAITYVLDVEALINREFYGASTPTNGLFSPSSPAYDPDRPLPIHNIRQAERLLDAAGWPRMDGGWRVCHKCLNHTEGALLSLDITIPYNDLALAIVEQFSAVGIRVNLHSDLASDLQLLYIDVNKHDIHSLFTSYYSSHTSELIEVLDAARYVPDCNPEEQFALYQQAQDLMDEAFQVIWLDAPHDFYAWRRIEGIDPRPGDPFWNVMEWRAAR